MPSAKGQTYARSLDLVRRAALWDKKAPITAKGQLVTSTGGPDATASAAQADQVIHSLLNRAAQTDSESDAIHLQDDPERGRVYMTPLVREADRGSAEWALERVENAAKDVSQGGRGTGSEQDRNLATIVQALVHYAIGEFPQCIGALDQADTHVPDRGVEEGYDLALLVMASALRGLAQEREGALPSALDQYKATIKVYDACVALLKGSDNRNEEMHAWAEEVMYRLALLSRTHTNEAESLEAHRAYMFHSRYWPTSFRLNKRAAFLGSYLQLLYLSSRRGSYRPAGARASKDEASEEKPGSAATNSSFASQQGPSSAWRQEVLSVQRAYESILRRTTKFPRAGSVNQPMLDFCDLAVEGWTLGGKRGEDADEVVEMLYRATTLTFQSQRILRHLVELLTAKGSYEEAAGALKLYVQLFQRAKETGAGEAEKQIKQSRKKANPDEEKFAGDDGGFDEPEKGPGGDWDSDEQFVATLVAGVRLLVKHLDKPVLATEMAETAAKVVEEDDDRFGAKLKSRVERMRGIAYGAQSNYADRETRPGLQTKYLSHLTRAVQLDANSFENLYHLAFAQAELRQVGEAIKTARKAVELAPTSKQAWHLLALLVTAQRDLRMALDVIDSGLADANEGSGDQLPNGGEPAAAPTPKVNGRPKIESRPTESDEEFEDAAEDSNNQSANQSEGDLLQTPRPGGTKADKVQQQINSLSTAVASGNSDAVGAASRRPKVKLEFLQSEADDLEATVQLRMTRNVIIESIEGAEAALQDQQTLFIFFSQIASLIKTKVPSKNYAQPAPIKPSTGPQIDTHIASRNPSIIKSLGRRNVSGASQANGAPAGRSHQRGASVSSNVSALAGGVGSNEVQEEDPEQTRQAEKALRARSDALLQTLWLMSSATFRRWGKQQECKGAIQEAEALNPDNAEVWVQFGLFALSSGDLPGTVNCLRKALVYTHDYIPAVVHLARLFIEEGSVELAEGLLDVATQTNGWDVPEAWFLLGQVLEKTRRQQRSRECLLYALQLEETKPIRPLGLSIPRVL